MAAGAAPAPEKTCETKVEAAENAPSKPATLKERILARLHHIFQGRDEFLGWRQ